VWAIQLSIHSIVNWFIHSFADSYIHSFVHSFSDSSASGVHQYQCIVPNSVNRVDGSQPRQVLLDSELNSKAQQIN